MFKSLIIGSLLALFAFAENLCPKDRQTECQNDITKGTSTLISAYQICLEAAKEKGQDQDADIACVKYFLAMRK